MSSLKELVEQGKALELEGEDLRGFIKEQQIMLRDERQALRDKEKHERDVKLAEDKARLALELEQAKVLNEMKLKSLEHEQQVHLLEKQAELRDLLGPVDPKGKSSVAPKSPKIPAFDERTDEMDSYLRRFERYAGAQSWREEDWATNLSALLKGKALDVYALLPPEHALDYECLKTALLKRFDKTEDGFKRKFRSCRPELGENFSQCAVRLNSYLMRWIEMSKIEESFEELLDLMVRDQFLFMCSRDLTMFLLERQPKTVEEMARLADRYREARFCSAQSLCGHSGKSQRETGTFSESKPVNIEPVKKPFEKSDTLRRCYRCGKMGHIASECWPKGKGRRDVGSVQYDQDKERRNVGSSRNNPQSCGACTTCTIHTQTETEIQSCNNSLANVTTLCHQQNEVGNMPLVSGFVESEQVLVLRDTGCSGVVVKKAKVPVDNFTGELQTIILADGSRIEAPVAVIHVDTPYLEGKQYAWCLENPSYELIIGNVPAARSPDSPDPEWKKVREVKTREPVMAGLKVPEITKVNALPDDVRKVQPEDVSLRRAQKRGNNDNYSSKKGKCTHVPLSFDKIAVSEGAGERIAADPLQPKKHVTETGSVSIITIVTLLASSVVTAAVSFSRSIWKAVEGVNKVGIFLLITIILATTLLQHLQGGKVDVTRLADAKLTTSQGAEGFRVGERLRDFVDDGRLRPRPDKVKAIEEAQRLRTRKRVILFLKLIGSDRKCIPRSTGTALLVTDEAKKQSQVSLTSAHEKVFQYEADHKMPVAYASRKLKESETNYSTIEKECLAIVWSVQKFSKYLYGREFCLETDHHPLTYLNTSKVANARLMRWALLLQPYGFTLVAIKGSENVVGV